MTMKTQLPTSTEYSTNNAEAVAWPMNSQVDTASLCGSRACLAIWRTSVASRIAEAAQPTLDEVLARAGGRAGGSLPLADAVSALQFDRARH